MTKLYADAGTTWTKILEIYEEEKDIQKSSLLQINNLNNYFVPENGNKYYSREEKLFTGRTFIMPTKIFSFADIKLDGATGHMTGQKLKPEGIYQNEVVSLAYGAQKRVKNLENSTIIDIGSRDVKWVKFENNQYKDLDWNGSCGSATGATIEMLCGFYGVNPENLAPEREKIPVTCGVFAMEKIMDNIASGIPPEIAVARYIHGIAYNAWIFSKKPEKVYLSGGLCRNKCFIESLKLYCEAIPLGRFMLIEGLY
ncbi:MAG TPA: hypothetical protein P5556_11125 [Candidatus Gastranaerophilales bacterium]|nr:hypothetical protein [Candidatus Gastranaerophilales bacterium]